ncbi:MAG: UDP-glucose 4-epimerase GalE [Magnetospirillum sp.]
MLVTGGAGYIGSHTCKALAQAGFRPLTIDDLSIGHARAVRWGPLEVGDIGDAAFVDTVLAHYRPVATLHFAASSIVEESIADPLRYYRNNVGNTLTLLDRLLAHGIRDLVFASSAAIYGVGRPGDDPPAQAPLSPYGQSKMTVERILQDMRGQGAINAVSLRYFNVCGADPDGEIGEDHIPETHLIPNVVSQARTGGRLAVHGTDYPTADGTCVRDYVHVTDLAQAQVAVLRRLATGQLAPCLDVGHGRGASILEVIAAVESSRGIRLDWYDAGRRRGDPAVLVAAAETLPGLLGHPPRFSDMATILDTTWKWQTAQAGV